MGPSTNAITRWLKHQAETDYLADLWQAAHGTPCGPPHPIDPDLKTKLLAIGEPTPNTPSTWPTIELKPGQTVYWDNN